MAVYDRATKAVLPEEQNEVNHMVKARNGRLRQSHQGSSTRGTNLVNYLVKAHDGGLPQSYQGSSARGTK